MSITIVDTTDIETGFVKYKDEKYIKLKDQNFNMIASSLEICYEFVKEGKFCKDTGMSLRAKAHLTQTNSVQVFGDMPTPNIGNVVFKVLANNGDFNYKNYLSKVKSKNVMLDMKKSCESSGFGTITLYLPHHEIERMVELVTLYKIDKLQCEIHMDNVFIKFGELKKNKQGIYPKVHVLKDRKGMCSGSLMGLRCLQSLTSY